MKNIKISKELLENVLDFKIEKFQMIGTSSTTQVRIWKENNHSDFLNDYCVDIHQFFFLCKSWAFKKGYFLHYIVNINPITFTYILNIEDRQHNVIIKRLDIECNNFSQDLELKCIFKACEWILNEKS